MNERQPLPEELEQFYDERRRNEMLGVIATAGWANEGSGSTASPYGRFWRMSNYPSDAEQLQDVFGPSLYMRDMPVERVLGHWLITDRTYGREYEIEEHPDEPRLIVVYKRLKAAFGEWYARQEGTR